MTRPPIDKIVDPLDVRGPEAVSFLRSVFENIPNMIFVKDAATLRFVGINRAGEEFLGLSRDELQGRSDHDFFPPEQADFFTAEDRAVLAGRRPTDIPEEPVLTRHRGTRIVHTKKVPILDEAGNPLYLLGISEDVTELRDIQQRLTESERQLRAILEAIPDLIFRLDRHGRFLSFVPARGIPTLAPESEFIGRSLTDILPPEAAALASAALARAFASQAPQTIEYELREEDSHRSFEARIAPMSDADAVALVRDVTLRKTAEEQALRQQRELARAGRLSTMGEMATGLAHELNQPLGAILNHAEACMLSLHSGNIRVGDLLEDLSAIAAQAERATLIIRHLRDFVRKTSRSYAAIDLEEAVRSTIEFVRFEARAAGIGLVTEFTGAPILVSADLVELQQVVMNLVRNAMEAVARQPEPREVRLATGVEADWAELSVRNEGPVLPAGLVEEFFTPYYSSKPDGLGLGLSISRSIVENLHGHLVGSANPEGGATFQVRIPLTHGEGAT